MVVKFFSNKKGGSAKAINYLLNEREQQGTARVLQGDPDLTRQIINDIKFKQKTTVGCLSFEEQNISEDMKYQLMQDFEKHLLPSMQDRYNILWVEHTDKGRLELNFVIPKIDLVTQKSLNPYYHKADLPRVEKWQDLQNLKYEFSNPKDPSKQRTLQTDSKEIGLSRDYEQLDKLLHNLTEQGQINNREQLVELLQSNQIEVTRKGKDYLSIKLPDSKKARKFKGSIYDEQFTSIREIETLSEKAEHRAREYNNRDTQRELERLNADLKSYTQTKERELRKKYPTTRERTENKNREIEREFNKDTQEKVKYDRGNDREQNGKREQSKNHTNSNNNIHFDNSNNIDNSLLYDKQTVSRERTDNILFLHDRTQQQQEREVNDSTKSTINERTGTRARPEFKAYIESRKPRSELLAELKKTARALREQSIANSTKLREKYKAVAPRISSDDEAREESLLRQARENYRAFDSYKRVAERVAEAVGKFSDKFEQFGIKIIQFFERARGKQSDNSKTITRINEKIEREKHQSQSHHHLRYR